MASAHMHTRGYVCAWPQRTCTREDMCVHGLSAHAHARICVCMAKLDRLRTDHTPGRTHGLPISTRVLLPGSTSFSPCILRSVQQSGRWELPRLHKHGMGGGLGVRPEHYPDPGEASALGVWSMQKRPVSAAAGHRHTRGGPERRSSVPPSATGLPVLPAKRHAWGGEIRGSGGSHGRSREGHEATRPARPLERSRRPRPGSDVGPGAGGWARRKRRGRSWTFRTRDGTASAAPSAGAMAEYGSLLQELTDNITVEDLEQLKSACKEDIPSERSEEITTGSAWFSFLEAHNKLDKDNLSYIEHIFEISRRPDLLTMVLDYRTRVLKISAEDELDTKLTRIPSAKKYKDVIRQPSEEDIIKLAPPPKKA